MERSIERAFPERAQDRLVPAIAGRARRGGAGAGARARSDLRRGIDVGLRHPHLGHTKFVERRRIRCLQWRRLPTDSWAAIPLGVRTGGAIWRRGNTSCGLRQRRRLRLDGVHYRLVAEDSRSISASRRLGGLRLRPDDRSCSFGGTGDGRHPLHRLRRCLAVRAGPLHRHRQALRIGGGGNMCRGGLPNSSDWRDLGGQWSARAPIEKRR